MTPAQAEEQSCPECEGFGRNLRYLEVSDRDGTWSEAAWVECPQCEGTGVLKEAAK